MVDTLDAWSSGADDPGRGVLPAAAVRGAWSIVVAGAEVGGQDDPGPGAVRPDRRDEAIGTFETEYELHLDESGRHKIVIDWEARPGVGELGADGRAAGEFDLDEALVDSFRFNLSRQIVGEVRGKEIWAMIKAMESGTGSISTTHAADAAAVPAQARDLRDGGRPARHPGPGPRSSPPAWI